MKTTTKPISLDERRAARRKNLPDALSREQLRRRAVSKMRHNLASLADDKYEDAKRWLELIEVTDGPRAAFDSYLKLLEFAVPKLSRAEVSVEDGGKTHKADLSMEDLQAIIAEGIAARDKEERTVEGEYDDLTGESEGSEG